MQITRFESPIITPATDPSIGDNINGPSLIRVPEWVAQPLGRYYLYFAHHGGQFIRLACADDLAGPWRVHRPGALSLDDCPCRGHVASPDVHVDAAARQIRMYYHGVTGRGQETFLATSDDGLSFSSAGPEPLAPFYLRAFEHEGTWYGLAKAGNEGGVLVRSPDGLAPFEIRPSFLPNMRHAAVRRVGPRRVEVFFSRAGDCPERILRAGLDLAGDWRHWQLGPFEEVLAPERTWEGADLPAEPSSWGAVHERVRQLRDPAIFTEAGRTFLLYSIAGERGIAIAELHDSAL
jgi:hypothetical protein